MKILVAEDEPSIRELYKIVLELHGHEIFLTDNGQDCINIFHKHLEASKSLSSQDTADYPTPFDIVLLDYRMPQKDGLQVATEILSANPRQKIVMVSAFAADVVEGLTRALKNSIKILEKPIEIENLHEILENERNRISQPYHANTRKNSQSTLWISENLREKMK